MSTIHFENVSKHFEDGIIPKKVQVLQNLNFSIEQGNTHIAFEQKMNKDKRNQVFLEGMIESPDNESLKQSIKSKIKQKE